VCACVCVCMCAHACALSSNQELVKILTNFTPLVELEEEVVGVQVQGECFDGMHMNSCENLLFS
jgi:hypothetical protein